MEPQPAICTVRANGKTRYKYIHRECIPGLEGRHSTCEKATWGALPIAVSMPSVSVQILAVAAVGAGQWLAAGTIDHY